MKYRYSIVCLVLAVVLVVLPGLAQMEPETDRSSTSPGWSTDRAGVRRGRRRSIFAVRIWQPAKGAIDLVEDGARIFPRPTASSCGVLSALRTFGSTTRVRTW